MSKIYVASSWRNQDQPHIVQILREHGHDVTISATLHRGITAFTGLKLILIGGNGLNTNIGKT
jgi:hypothetical protein